MQDFENFFEEIVVDVSSYDASNIGVDHENLVPHSDFSLQRGNTSPAALLCVV